MPIEKSTVKARIKVLHPNTNLSQTRLDEISDRLIKKLTDDADETAIDAVINDFNDYNPLSDIARGDDKMRDLEAKAKKNEPKADPPKTDDEDIDLPADTPEWAKALLEQNKSLATRLEGFEKGQQTKSLTERFNSDERIKDVPDLMRLGFIPGSEDEYETKVTSLLDGYTKYNESYKVEKIGNDKPAGQQGGEGKPKEASKEAVDAVVDKIRI